MKAAIIMSVPKITVITCFCYRGNRKYLFNPQYLRSDLCRIILYSHNRIGCSLEDIYVITDISPIKETRTRILNDFQTEVLKYLCELGYRSTSLPKCSQPPLQWLKQICNQLSPNSTDLYQKITYAILPLIRSSNIVEFANLFANLIQISGQEHYDHILSVLLGKPMSHLFFYYTGHGIRLHPSDICLVIPGPNAKAEFYSKCKLQDRFQPILQTISAFIVFDCCHGELLFELPHQLDFYQPRTSPCPEHSFSTATVIYLCSTTSKQTCGFYKSNKEQGSLFTYYLIQLLESLNTQRSKDLTRLYEVEEKVTKYREVNGKPAQNMIIKLSKQITDLPFWLFSIKSCRSLELMEDNSL